MEWMAAMSKQHSSNSSVQQVLIRDHASRMKKLRHTSANSPSSDHASRVKRARHVRRVSLTLSDMPKFLHATWLVTAGGATNLPAVGASSLSDYVSLFCKRVLACDCDVKLHDEQPQSEQDHTSLAAVRLF